MKTKLIFLSICCICLGCATNTINGYSHYTMKNEKTVQRGFSASNGVNIPYRLYCNGNTCKRKLVFMMHGAGERGTENNLQLKYGINQLAEYAEDNDIPVVIVAPQCPTTKFWKDDDMMEALEELVNYMRYSNLVYTNKITMTGFSMGGDCAWRFMIRYPEQLEKIVPICGGPLSWDDDSEYFGITPESSDIKIFAVNYMDDTIIKNYPSKYVTGTLWTIDPGEDIHYSERITGGHTHEAYCEKDILEWILQ